MDLQERLTMGRKIGQFEARERIKDRQDWISQQIKAFDTVKIHKKKLLAALKDGVQFTKWEINRVNPEFTVFTEFLKEAIEAHGSPELLRELEESLQHRES